MRGTSGASGRAERGAEEGVPPRNDQEIGLRVAQPLPRGEPRGGRDAVEHRGRFDRRAERLAALVELRRSGKEEARIEPPKRNHRE